MRKLMMITGFALSSGLLLAQAGGHGGATSGGHAGGVGMRSAGRATGGPVSRGGAPARSLTGGAYGQGYGSGSWTSAGFIPNHSGPSNGYAPGSRRNRVGYGYTGYPGLLGYPFGYYPAFYGGLGLDDNDGDDPNLQNAVPGGSSYPGGNDPGASQEAYAGAPDGYYAYAPESGRPAYQRSVTPPRPSSSEADSDGLEHPKVTLVFKDGHTLKIQNYAATRSKIFVRDAGAERDIPVATLDVAATKAANEDAGVDFSLPEGH